MAKRSGWFIVDEFGWAKGFVWASHQAAIGKWVAGMQPWAWWKARGYRCVRATWEV